MKGHVVVVLICLIATIVLFWTVGTLLLRPPYMNAIEVAGTDAAKNAKDALGLLKDSTVWMAGLQTATLTALGFLAKDGLSTLRPGKKLVYLAIAVAWFNTLALFFSAWVLTSLPSINLRLYDPSSPGHDFFNYTLHAFMQGKSCCKVFTLQLMVVLNHWLWAIGAVLFGVLGISLFIARSNAPRRSV